jgi:hypothetical protein
METLNKLLLIALIDFAQSDVPANVQSLAGASGASRKEVATALNNLAKLGLVRPDTLRLTMVGLLHAAGLRSRRAHQGSVAA